MHRTLQTTLLVALVCLCLLNVVVVRFIYVRYGNDSESIRALERQVQTMEWKLDFRSRWETRTSSKEIVTRSTGPTNLGSYTLYLDFRISGAQRFELGTLKSVGHAVGAWVSEWKPHSEMLKFEEFHVVPNPETGKIELLAMPRTNESINMKFTITVFEESFRR